MVAVPAAQYGHAERGECQHAHGFTDIPVGEIGVSISKEDWDRERHVGSPHIFPAIVNCLLAKPFCSWLCSMLGIVLIVKGHGILLGKLVEHGQEEGQCTVTASYTQHMLSKSCL